jgi:hypothetical protein
VREYRVAPRTPSMNPTALEPWGSCRSWVSRTHVETIPVEGSTATPER